MSHQPNETSALRHVAGLLVGTAKFLGYVAYLGLVLQTSEILYRWAIRTDWSANLHPVLYALVLLALAILPFAITALCGSQLLTAVLPSEFWQVKICVPLAAFMFLPAAGIVYRDLDNLWWLLWVIPSGLMLWGTCYSLWDSRANQLEVPEQSSEAVAAHPVQHPIGSRPDPQSDIANRETYDFNWQTPKGGLDSLAGMADLKNELLSVLGPYRGYAKGGPVADRNGILLSGPPGNGKTAFAVAIAGELGLPLVKIGVQDLTSKWINESPSMIRDLFTHAIKQPCVVFFDEFDAVAASRGSDYFHHEDKKVVNTLLSEIDSARSKRIVLLAATNYLESLDTAIVRDGRFDFRIEIPYPDHEARVSILASMLAKHRVKADAVTIARVAQLWERRSVAYIESVAKRLRDESKGRFTAASVHDFKLASRAASRRQSAIPASGAQLSEIALPKSVRLEADSLLYRLRNWESIAERGGEPPSGLLLYGPPGTGKTNFVRAMARELGDWHVFEVNAADVLQNPNKFRETMELATQHRPSFVFIDEADDLLRERSHSASASATNEILKAMDGMMGRVPEVVFVAATNAFENIDAAALRGGRFAEKIFMGRLEGADLVSFLEHVLKTNRNLSIDRSITAQALADLFEVIAPADALSIFKKAVNYTFMDDRQKPLTMQDVVRARAAIQVQ